MIHHIFKKDISFPEGGELDQAVFGMGCFWGAEKKFWELEGVKLTAVGYAGGITKNPGYRDVCTGLTGHNEVVKVLFDPTEISYIEILGTFWENHDPTQLNRQGNDIGTQYRSEIFYETDQQKIEAFEILNQFNEKLDGKIQTNISKIKNYCRAEEYHQKYIEKNK